MYCVFVYRNLKNRFMAIKKYVIKKTFWTYTSKPAIYKIP